MSLSLKWRQAAQGVIPVCFRSFCRLSSTSHECFCHHFPVTHNSTSWGVRVGGEKRIPLEEKFLAYSGAEVFQSANRAYTKYPVCMWKQVCGRARASNQFQATGQNNSASSWREIMPGPESWKLFSHGSCFSPPPPLSSPALMQLPSGWKLCCTSALEHGEGGEGGLEKQQWHRHIF